VFLMSFSVFRIIYDSFEEVYERYKRVMKNISFSILQDWQYSEDAVQDAMSSLAKNEERLKKFSENECKNYIYVTARNAAIDIYRKRKKEWENENFVQFDADDSLCNTEGVADVHAFANEYGFSDKLIEAMNRLEPMDKDILCYKYGAGYNAVEIAKMLDKSSDYVRKRLQRAEKKLAEFVEL